MKVWKAHKKRSRMVLTFRRDSAHREIVRAGNVLFTVALSHSHVLNSRQKGSSVIS
ncbi:hypothetical protein V8C26DRAFT_392212 [Trichoderma gracile]